MKRGLPKPDVTPAADSIMYVPSRDLRPNRVTSRKKKTSVWQSDMELYDGHEGLLVRTALMRPASYQEETEPVVIKCPADVVRLCKHLKHVDQEHFVVLAVNAQNRVVAIHETGIGTRTASYAAVNDVLKIPILCGALAFIVVHNHPSGKAAPSEEDMTMTKTLKQAAPCIGLQLLDHIVIGFESAYSFVEGGYI